MGQYYKPISIERKEFVYSHDYGNGLKLMEHSWIGNNFVGVVENLIKRGGAWHGTKILWAGDYADSETGKEDSKNMYRIVGDEGTQIKPKEFETKGLRFLINLDTKQFVDLKKVPVSDVYIDDEGGKHNYKIHPLPLLTCEGNGRGGGDYHKHNKLIGL